MEVVSENTDNEHKQGAHDRGLFILLIILILILVFLRLLILLSSKRGCGRAKRAGDENKEGMYVQRHT